MNPYSTSMASSARAVEEELERLGFEPLIHHVRSVCGFDVNFDFSSIDPNGALQHALGTVMHFGIAQGRLEITNNFRSLLRMEKIS